MIRKFITLFICLSASISVVGFGFCAWYFIDNIQVESQISPKLMIDLKDVQHLGYFEKSEFPTNIVLEEGGNSNDLYDGINFYNYVDDEPILDDTLSITFVYDPNIYAEENFDVGLKLKVTINGNLANYIFFAPNKQSSDDGFVDFSYFGSSYTIIDNTYHLEISLSNYFSYIDLSLKPTTKEKYQNLYQDLYLNQDGGLNTIIFEIEVYTNKTL